jgi:hypothetical protein
MEEYIPGKVVVGLWERDSDAIVNGTISYEEKSAMNGPFFNKTTSIQPNPTPSSTKPNGSD